MARMIRLRFAFNANVQGCKSPPCTSGAHYSGHDAALRGDPLTHCICITSVLWPATPAVLPQPLQMGQLGCNLQGAGAFCRKVCWPPVLQNGFGVLTCRLMTLFCCIRVMQSTTPWWSQVTSVVILSWYADCAIWHAASCGGGDFVAAVQVSHLNLS
jgi:hypothetical protein